MDEVQYLHDEFAVEEGYVRSHCDDPRLPKGPQNDWAQNCQSSCFDRDEHSVASPLEATRQELEAAV